MFRRLLFEPQIIQHAGLTTKGIQGMSTFRNNDSPSVASLSGRMQHMGDHFQQQQQQQQQQQHQQMETEDDDTSTLADEPPPAKQQRKQQQPLPPIKKTYKRSSDTRTANVSIPGRGPTIYKERSL